MPLINPATEETLRDHPDHTPSQVENIIGRSRAAYPLWRALSITGRATLMGNLGAELRRRSTELASIMTREMGKPVTAAEAEIEKCAAACDFFAARTGQWLTAESISTDATKSYVRYDPLGPILAIMPWNFPFWQLFRFAAPALMAGNTTILKHAPNVPACAEAIEALFHDAGFTDGVLVNIRVDNARAEQLIRHEAIAAVTLTGSTRAGRAVATAAASVLKKCVLELGGSDPFIVLPDADLMSVAATAAQARCINSGQSCIAAKRFIIVDQPAGRAAEFARAMSTAMLKLKVGDPTDRSTDLGPLARLDLLENLHDQVQRSLVAGAQLLIGGHRLPRPGFFYAPTILTHVTPANPTFQEETFGPVAALITARDADDAIRLANLSPYGLGSSIWTRDTAVAEQLAPKIESGNVFINGIVKSDPRLPFGGIKQSGYGRELSAHGLHEFTNIKCVWIQKAPQSASPSSTE